MSGLADVWALMRALHPPTRRPLTGAEIEAGLCPACYKQPCVCAERKEPGWVDRLQREIDQEKNT